MFVAGDPRRAALPPGFRIALDPEVRFFAGGKAAVGGSPWRVVRFGEAALRFLANLRSAGSAGAVPVDPAARALARSLLDRGLAHPLFGDVPSACHDVEIVVPIFGPAKVLEGCLSALAGLRVIVIDDGSLDPEAVRAVAALHGARLVRHGENRGPAAARNTGATIASSDLVAFVDADCRPCPGWLDRLIVHFEDPRVVAVAPRIVSSPEGTSALARYEASRSSLDMGSRSEVVRAGGRLGFVPTAAVVVRREVVLGHRFDELLRFGEDVDLVWRLADRGWLVRYEPRATVLHEPRLALGAWLGRRCAYGTSAGTLARRHPGRLAPARLSFLNLASIALVAAGHPFPAAASIASAARLLHLRLAPFGIGPSASAAIVARGLLSDCSALGSVFRREWWPIGAAALAASALRMRRRQGCLVSRRGAPVVSVLMLAPLVLEMARARPRLDPFRYVGLRLLEDAAYGVGVIAGAAREQTIAPLVPEVRLPKGPPAVGVAFIAGALLGAVLGARCPA